MNLYPSISKRFKTFDPVTICGIRNWSPANNTKRNKFTIAFVEAA